MGDAMIVPLFPDRQFQPDTPTLDLVCFIIDGNGPEGVGL
jgi:hypothetical protein